MQLLLVAMLVGWFCSVGFAQTVSPLFARGYTVMPQPQKVSLGDHDFIFDDTWQLQLGKGVADGDTSVAALQEGLRSRFHMTMGISFNPSGILTLRIEPGSVEIGKTQDPHKEELESQAYRITLQSRKICITANAPTGLFYGVETFVQLLQPKSAGLQFPEGSIEDWPDLELRLIFWDDSHHLDRMDALKRALRQAAFYKVNGFVLKLNGHFQYQSAPAVVEPYALSASQLRELTNYGRHFHIRLIPYLDGPGNVAFILKHPEYKQLREFPDNNYEICATNVASYKLLQDMSRELIYATEGVDYFLGTSKAEDYFFLPTDNPYFLGMAQNSQCNEASLEKQLGSPGQVYVHFVDETGNFLRDHHRIVLFSGFDPLKPNDVASLPYYLVNSLVRGPDFDQAYDLRKIPQILNTYAGGRGYLFPSYFSLPRSKRLHESKADEPLNGPKITTIMDRVSSSPSRKYPNVIGEISSGWGDEGANPEGFWMGYIASDSAGWHPGTPDAKEWESTFYSLFYGDKTVDMDGVYRLMSEQARVWKDSWDWIPSTSRKPIWGSYQTIYDPPRPAQDQTLPLPPTPDANLAYSSSWSSENARRIELAARAKHANDILLRLLHENIQKTQFNQYNLQVYLALAHLFRQNSEMIAGIHQMDMDLTSASRIRDKDPKAALKDVDHAFDIAQIIRRQRNKVLRNTIAIWDKSWFPRVSEANGRHFLHQLDDVKDPLAGRTVDMSYLILREKQLPFGQWVNAMLTARNTYATAHHLPERHDRLAWDDLDLNTPASAEVSPKQ